MQEFFPSGVLFVDFYECRAQRLPGIIDLVAVSAAGTVAIEDQLSPQGITFEREDVVWINGLSQPIESLRFGDERFEQPRDVCAGILRS